MIALFPIIPLFFSKGFLFIDIDGIPVISFYRLYVLSLLGVTLILIIQNKLILSRSFRFNLIKPLFVLAFTYFLVFLLNINTKYSGGVVLLSFVIEVLIPVILFVSVIERMAYSEYLLWFKAYVAIYISVAMYGIIAYYLDFNPFVGMLESTLKTGRVLVHTYAETLRGTRAQGTVYHPINFGALMVFGLALLFSLNHVKRIKVLYLCVFTASFFLAIFVSNSRTPLVFGLFFILFQSLYLNANKKFWIYSAAIVFFFALLSTSNYFSSKVESVLVIFFPDAGENMHGSTLDMRVLQFYVSLKYFLQSPVFGNGLEFSRFLILDEVEADLYNTESLFFLLMINFGLVGIFAYSYFFYGLYNIKKEIVGLNRTCFSLCLSLLLGYILFVIATGFVETLYTFVFIYFSIFFLLKKYSDINLKLNSGACYGN